MFCFENKPVVILCALFLSAAVFCAGCVNGTGDIFGAWSYEGVIEGTPFTERVVFNADGTGSDTFTVEGFSAVLSFTWKKGEGNSYLVTDEAGVELVYEFDAAGNSLSCGGQKFVRVK